MSEYRAIYKRWMRGEEYADSLGLSDFIGMRKVK